MTSSSNTPVISRAIESARRARIIGKLDEPPREQDPGHRWKLICDLENNQATLEVDIGSWWRKKRVFYPSHEFTYPVQFRAGKDSVVYNLDIKAQVEESYRAAGVKLRVAAEEFYDDIIIEAHIDQSGSVDHKQLLADHPSVQFATMQKGTDFQFMTEWESPSFQEEWSAPFGLTNEVKLHNTAIYLFEEKPVVSYSIFEVDKGLSQLAPVSYENLAPRASKPIKFQLAPAQLTLTPPQGLQLQKFIVDPAFGQGG